MQYKLFLKLLPGGTALDTGSLPGGNLLFGDPGQAERKSLCLNGTGKCAAAGRKSLCALSPPGSLSHMPYNGRADKERSLILLQAPRALPVPAAHCLLSRIYQQVPAKCSEIPKSLEEICKTGNLH